MNDPTLRAPRGACDCHMHFYGPRDRYPLAPTCPVEPPTGRVSDYREIQARLGLERVVIVQPTAYGFDNRCQLDAVAELGDCARAVVVVGPDVVDSELERLTAAGVRGVRFHMLPGGVLPWEQLPEMAARVHEFGWHVQLQLDGRILLEKEGTLSRLPGTVVIDHVGKFLEPVTVEHPSFQAMLRLVDSGRWWVKLSAPYETSKTGPPLYEDVGSLAKALVRAAPERMLWASNWPHPSAQDNRPDDAVLLDVLLDWIDDGGLRSRVLVDNPAELYGF